MRRPTPETVPAKALEKLTIPDRGLNYNAGRQHIIDTAAQVGWLITDERAAAVQARLLAKGWTLALRDSTYGMDPVNVDIRNFAGAYGADVELWLASARRQKELGSKHQDGRIAVMEGLIARRAAAGMKAAA